MSDKKTPRRVLRPGQSAHPRLGPRDGRRLGYVRLEPEGDNWWASATIHTAGLDGQDDVAVTTDPGPADGCEWSYPPGTTGHPADLPAELRLVPVDAWQESTTLVALRGGQGRRPPEPTRSKARVA
ncbi:hypothetical protein ACIBO5_17645 [Nonomuraea angiospora]|uniref:hypothetical protein n=1 Tax=Nonomuraea angiospora TaxID=46172 RepID=UPI00379C78FB